MGTHHPLPQSAQPYISYCPNFRPISVAAAWIKMLLGMELGLGPGDFVLDGEPTPLPQKGHIVVDGVPAPSKGAQQPPSFRPMSIVATVAHLSYCWAFVRTPNASWNFNRVFPNIAGAKYVWGVKICYFRTRFISETIWNLSKTHISENIVHS